MTKKNHYIVLPLTSNFSATYCSCLAQNDKKIFGTIRTKCLCQWPQLYSFDSNYLFSCLQVTVNWFQMQQAQVVSLPVNFQSLCENAKLYEPGLCYTEFVKSLPSDRTRVESFSFDISGTQNTGYVYIPIRNFFPAQNIPTEMSIQENLFWNHYSKFCFSKLAKACLFFFQIFDF